MSIAAARSSSRRRNLNLPNHTIIVARAGTGKTTTGINGLNVMRGEEPTFEPSAQQLAIYEEFIKSSEARSIAMVAFNVSIAKELESRVPQPVVAMTVHRMGRRIVDRCLFPARGENAIDGNKPITTLELLSNKPRRKMDPDAVGAVNKLVGLCKTTLAGDYDREAETYHVEHDQLDDICSRYDIAVEDKHRKHIYPMVERIVERHANFEDGDQLDFNDMVWLPVIRDLPAQPYDLLFVDEAQDLDPVKQALALKCGRRLIFCGDDKQAIYGFTGADTRSLTTLYDRLSKTSQGCVRLPLTKTYRCGHAIVAEAKRLVPDFEADESNPEGKVQTMPFKADNTPSFIRRDDSGEETLTMKQVRQLARSGDELQRVAIEELINTGTHGQSLAGNSIDFTLEYRSPDWRDHVEDGDLILSRVNAPLVSECLKMIAAGRRAKIIGRSIGQGLIKLVKRLKITDFKELGFKLNQWRDEEKKLENRKANPSENRLILIDDKVDCILAVAEGIDNVPDLLEKIERLFSDEVDDTAVKLSSIHKAKGLEANRVWLFNHKHAPVPHPMAKTPEARAQELNLLYVGITRAIHLLTYLV